MELGELKSGPLSEFPLGMTVSPNGREMAYIDKQGQAYLYANGYPALLNLSMPVGRLLWGPTAWRIRYSSSKQPPKDCTQ